MKKQKTYTLSLSAEDSLFDLCDQILRAQIENLQLTQFIIVKPSVKSDIRFIQIPKNPSERFFESLDEYHQESVLLFFSIEPLMDVTPPEWLIEAIKSYEGSDVLLFPFARLGLLCALLNAERALSLQLTLKHLAQSDQLAHRISNQLTELHEQLAHQGITEFEMLQYRILTYQMCGYQPPVDWLDVGIHQGLQLGIIVQMSAMRYGWSEAFAKITTDVQTYFRGLKEWSGPTDELKNHLHQSLHHHLVSKLTEKDKVSYFFGFVDPRSNQLIVMSFQTVLIFLDHHDVKVIQNTNILLAEFHSMPLDQGHFAVLSQGYADFFKGDFSHLIEKIKAHPEKSFPVVFRNIHHTFAAEENPCDLSYSIIESKSRSMSSV